MTNTIKFIDTIIKSIKPIDKRQTFWCLGCPGFGIRVNPSGSKMFIFKYMAGSNKTLSRWVTIGKYPEWTIRQARREYDLLYDQVHSYGRDPVQEEKDAKKNSSAQKTVKELTEDYLSLSRLKGKTYIKEEERYFRQDIWPVIGDKLFSEVVVDDIECIQKKILERGLKNSRATRNGKTAVKNAIACVRRLFDLAIKKEYITQNPVKQIEQLGVTCIRSRILSFEEIWIFWNKVESLSISPVPAKALKFLLAPCVRIDVASIKN